MLTMSSRKRKLSEQCDYEKKKHLHLDDTIAADADDDDDDSSDNVSDATDSAVDDRLVWRLSKTKISPTHSTPGTSGQVPGVQREAGIIEEVRVLNFMSHSKLHFEYVVLHLTLLLLQLGRSSRRLVVDRVLTQPSQLYVVENRSLQISCDWKVAVDFLLEIIFSREFRVGGVEEQNGVFVYLYI